jgi:hypothetical protein
LVVPGESIRGQGLEGIGELLLRFVEEGQLVCRRLALVCQARVELGYLPARAA